MLVPVLVPYARPAVGGKTGREEESMAHGSKELAHAKPMQALPLPWPSPGPLLPLLASDIMPSCFRTCSWVPEVLQQQTPDRDPGAAVHPTCLNCGFLYDSSYGESGHKASAVTGLG